MAPALETVAAAPPLPTTGERFNALLDQLMAGQWGGITPADWQLVAVQGGMRVALVLVILFVALTLAGWASAAVRTSLTRMKFDPTLSKFLAKMARWSVLLLAGLNCLGYFGVEMTTFAAVLGATGFAIGLALQGTLSNFAAGAMLLLFRPFKVGDVVNIGGQLGKVDEIELFTTSIDTFDNRRIILPNGSVFGATIENVTYHPYRRIDVLVGADYAADIDQTRMALEQALVTTPGVLANPEPGVVLLGLGASSVDWRVQGWAVSKDFGDVKQALIRSVKMQLDAAGVGIPFPQMQIHVSEPPQQTARRAA
ncbi:mechanosensitive ion channel family protein [Botrimarina mediterranea]|uniref:Small-conductance mechanosensitive channel n=1 Tax=Botrimarina mediterranea TaxID=2528022 RepID=A0A518K5Y9_9BACT|nr:mechanosensitive ion channel domain-containing protein [Botrimarina mediterranea]QDV73187.1 Small-conductance mechanosensitive channel [Botrimarina mediterranea]QDV77760.1 Small-conductance mechanosensitive channel [Planctomycetes bacterium K2D]